MTLDQAWRRYLEDVEETRQMFLAEPILREQPALLASAYYLLAQTQTLAYNDVVAPRQDYPYFFGATYFDPLIYLGHLPCPDFLHRATFIDGKRSYRIWGKRNSAHWVDLQLNNGFWGEEGLKTLANYDLDEFQIGANGEFEIVASPESHPGNWIKLDPSSRNNYILVRQAMYDWEKEIPLELHIEAIDERRGAPIVHDEAEMIRRLDLAGRMLKYSVRVWTAPASRRILKYVAKNEFITRAGDGSRTANPLALYAQCIFEIGPEEALIVETDVPECRYWGISLGNWWFETVDYTFHQSSLNGLQARLDGDEKFRAVLAHEDPGVANWLNPVGWNTGLVLLRFYRAAHEPKVTTKRIALKDVRAHLPADTPPVSPQERADALTRRRRASLKRYGY
jgi:hypothetical protein